MQAAVHQHQEDQAAQAAVAHTTFQELLTPVAVAVQMVEQPADPESLLFDTQ